MDAVADNRFYIFSHPHALGAVMLFAALALWYRCHRARGLVHAHVLLLKYPVFVLLLAAGAGAAYHFGYLDRLIPSGLGGARLIPKDPKLLAYFRPDTRELLVGSEGALGVITQFALPSVPFGLA